MDVRLLESVPDAMVIVEADGGRIVHLNSLAEQLFGWPRDDIIGKPVEILVPASSRASHQADRVAYTASPRVRPMALGRQLSGLRRNGEQFPAEISLSPLHADGKVFVIAAVRDVSERKAIEHRAEAALRAAVAERELLVKEVHHRVKNNLEVIDSLLQLQAKAFPDPRVRGALGDTSNRVHAIAEVHDLLHRGVDLAHVDMKAYAETLLASLSTIFAADPDRVRVVVEGQPVQLDMRHAVPAGLILNELISNALRHAFPGDRKGTIAVVLRADAQCIELAVQDDGVALPEPLPSGTVGLKLVGVLAEQLRGALSFESAKGTTVRVRFPAATTA